MRKSLSMLLFAILLAGVARAQTVEELIEKNLAARGGKDKITAVQSIRMSGKLNMGGQMEMPMTMELKRPDKMRMEMTIQGMTLVQAYDGENGWTIMPFGGKKDPEPMPADQRKSMREQADFDGVLVNYKEKGHQIDLVGKEELEGTSVYKLKVTRKEGDVTYVYLDAESYLEIKNTMRRVMNGRDVETEIVYSDYKPVEGFLYAHSMNMKVKGGEAAMLPPSVTMTFDKIEVNPSIGMDRFEMPKPTAPAVPEGEPAP